MQLAPWWQTAVFYQIYPRSLADGNGDGIGDFAGLTAKLDYLRDLGVDALWLSPHYPSPLFDCGYDVADYTGVADEYGTLPEFHKFLDGAHARGLRVILDLVLNHTSHEHMWFKESALNRSNARADWYVWRPGRPGGGPPNNWLSLFGGSAWEYVPERDEYYYHLFFKEQPDLNWRNPAVEAAVGDAMRFWLARGVDGFRIDAIGALFEDPTLTDHTATITPEALVHGAGEHPTAAALQAIEDGYRALFGRQSDQPGVHGVIKRLRVIGDEFPGRMLVGETDDVSYYGQAQDELHMVFNFPLMRTPLITPAWVRANQATWAAGLPAGAWPANTLNNHDNSRVFTRYGDGRHDAQLARINLALLLTLPGTPFIYNGEEIGMTDLALDDLAQMKDLTAHWRYRVEREVYGLSHAAALALAAQHGRDKCRTPMQWAGTANGGFCPAAVVPWLPVNGNYAAGVNVAAQDADPASLLNFYRALLRVRKATPALKTGGLQWVDVNAEAYLAFVRPGEGEDALVVINMGVEPIEARLEGVSETRRTFGGGTHAAGQPLRLEPFEIYIGVTPRR